MTLSTFPERVVSRPQLQALPVFAEFELFAMPNRPNLFAVSAEQAVAIRGLAGELG